MKTKEILSSCRIGCTAGGLEVRSSQKDCVSCVAAQTAAVSNRGGGGAGGGCEWEKKLIVSFFEIEWKAGSDNRGCKRCGTF